MRASLCSCVALEDCKTTTTVSSTTFATTTSTTTNTSTTTSTTILGPFAPPLKALGFKISAFPDRLFVSPDGLITPPPNGLRF